MADEVVGRDQELAALREFVGAVPTGPQTLVVEGEAGIGKTTLWRAGVEEGEKRGFLVLTASPVEAETKLSFGALGDLLSGSAADVLPKLPSPQRRALEIALLLEDAQGRKPDPRTIAVAVSSTLGVLAEESPVLVAVDDVQWLDAPTANVLAFAARRLREERVGLLLARRLNGAPDAALGLRTSDTVSVGPLSLGAVHRLLSDRLGVVFPRPVTLKLHAVSCGNPFFALELARALQRRGEPLAPGEPLPVPGNLHDLVRERLEALPAGAAETLFVTAALSQPNVAVVTAACGRDVGAQLDAAVAADVLVLADDRIAFTHPLLASAVYSAAQPAKRRELHGRIAALVEDPEECARHLALAAQGPDEDIASALEEAAERAAARGALPAAAELAEQAVALTPSGRAPDSHRRSVAAAEHHKASGNATQAQLLLERALQAAPPGPRRAELLLALGRVCAGADQRTGFDYYRRAAAEPGVEGALRARILVRLASLQAEGEQRARAHAREAAELAERLGDAETLANALAALVDIAVASGERPDLALVDRVLALEGSPGEFGIVGPAYTCADALHYAGELDRARPLLERLCEVGRARGDMTVTLPLATLTQGELWAGNWDRAEQLAQETYDLAEQGERKVDIARALINLGGVAAMRGEERAARRLAHEALVLTQSRGLQSRGPRWVLGILELSLGRYEAAYEALLPAVERNRELGVRVPFPQAVDAVEALVGLGRIDEARDLLTMFDAQARRMRLRWAMASAARARGLIAAAEGDLDSAQGVLSDALAEATHLGCRPELGRTLLALGQVQRRAKQRKAARETLDRALAVFEELGAKLWADRVRAELGRIGGRKPSDGVLTAGEHRVAELVAEGRSNKEVAAALFVSPKTVDVTLSRVYAKLGIHSRTELAHRLAAGKV